MKIRNTVGGVAMALGLLGTAAIGYAAPVEIEIRAAPPADRVEVVPAPRAGFIYEKGHYVYEADKYVWREGQFIKERQGEKYTPFVFEKRGDLYYYRPGYWEKVS